MNGERFCESFKQHVALLEGLKKVLQTVAENLPITKGAHRLMKALKYYGYKTGFSGGLLFLEIPAKELGIDYVHANELEIINGKLTGIIGRDCRW
jgi:phosphoserine phosphatase